MALKYLGKLEVFKPVGFQCQSVNIDVSQEIIILDLSVSRRSLITFKTITSICDNITNVLDFLMLVNLLQIL